MRKSLLVLPALATLAASMTVAPAFATDARTAIRLCEARAGCTYYVNASGVDILVDGHFITCPLNGDCVIIYRKATNADFIVQLGGATTQPGSSGGHSGADGFTGDTGGSSGGTAGTGHFIGQTGATTNAGLSSNPTKGKGIQPLH